jgi:crotonobetainyl-CoA:carnitine CoA-transferase CaiB-like acyl-CoA transferase
LNGASSWFACDSRSGPELALLARAGQTREIFPKVRAALIARTALEPEEVFGDRVPCSTARSIEDMFDHAPVQAEDLVAVFDHPLAGRCQGFCQSP